MSKKSYPFYIATVTNKKEQDFLDTYSTTEAKGKANLLSVSLPFKAFMYLVQFNHVVNLSNLFLPTMKNILLNTNR